MIVMNSLFYQFNFFFLHTRIMEISLMITHINAFIYFLKTTSLPRSYYAYYRHFNAYIMIYIRLTAH